VIAARARDAFTEQPISGRRNAIHQMQVEVI
jgi:hypothetical protein